MALLHLQDPKAAMVILGRPVLVLQGDCRMHVMVKGPRRNFAWQLSRSI